MEKTTVRSRVIGLMADGLPRSAARISNILDVHPVTASETCRILESEGLLVFSGERTRLGARKWTVRKA